MAEPWQRGTLYTELDRFKQALLGNLEAPSQRMVAQYADVYQALKVYYDRLALQVQHDIESGRPFSADRLRRMDYYTALMEQATNRLNSFSDWASAEALQAQRDAIALAQEANQQIGAAAVADDLVQYPNAQGYGQLPPGMTMDDIRAMFHNLPEGALDNLIGMTGDGTPLRDYFMDGNSRYPGLPEDVVQALERNLIRGLASGLGIEATTRLFDNAIGIGLERALRITRTETMRSFRLADAAYMEANSDIISGWRWTCSMSTNTCAGCLAMDGTVHDFSEELDDHPNGGCLPAPITKFGEALGPSPRSVKNEDGSYDTFTGTGEQWFDQQPASVQHDILGAAGYQAYREGKVTLQDFVGEHPSKTFGPTLRVKSLSEILGDEEE